MNFKLVSCFIFICYYANITTSNVAHKANTDFASPNCKSIVCEQANEQAKGLSKLALLDEFVSQTVFLLNDLMQNIDGEIEKSANSLLRYIHPNCQSTEKILLEVINKQKEKLSSASPALGQGIKPMTEENLDDDMDQSHSQSQSHSFTHSHKFSNERDGQNFVDKNSDDDNDDRYPQQSYDIVDGSEEQQFSNYDTTGTVNRNSGGSFVTKDVPKKDNLGSGGNSQKSEWKGVNKQEEETKWKQNNAWKPESSDQISTQHRPRVGKTFNTEVSGSTSSISSSRSVVFGGPKICRGVDKGSAFWVPGLDQWCVENCSKGYCPKTHCIC